MVTGVQTCALPIFGSTSVPGLAAKPILDLLPLVEDLSQVDRHAAALEALDYEYLGEFGIP